ncbi:venom allergen 3-like isoform X1 [Tribolium castaneum]|uniref:venom allergen 3-like isoform X1 n=1 Tax=Tribolium castaneum TaxID=7070 RepID=UPI00077D978E|nr:PREDICTED: venom allergen 3-like isoform X1 [Tribolium castaneum]XP_015839529.1 PREDICTED: venom allergen 3-like isoform X1 [Tribolium castaneum]|eukprot:XP_015839309.1 PREDICTED: venom allergen 3-like isoform X1 [Tribolium castaneum]
MANFALIVFAIFSLTIARADDCGEIFVKGLTDEEKQFIVNKHNEIRSWVMDGKVPGQPKGKNLNVLVWDDYLGTEAQKISDTCVFQHVPVQDDRFYVGQNLAGWGGEGPVNDTRLEASIMSWYNEYPKFIYPDNFSNAAHYTQVIWDTTQYIGCGYTYYRKSPNDAYSKLFVCNYGPGGNIVGVAPYEKA